MEGMLGLLCLIAVTAAQQHYHHSTASLIPLMEKELEFVEALQMYYERQQAFSEAVKRYFDERVMIDVDAANPLDNFVNLRGFTINWKHLQTPLMQTVNTTKDLNYIVNHLEKELPTSDDVVGAAKGIIKLQRIYHLKESDIIKGMIKTNSSVYQLKAENCLFLAKAALQAKEYDLARKWYQVALDMESDESNSVINQMKHDLLDSVFDTQREWETLSGDKEVIKLYEEVCRLGSIQPPSYVYKQLVCSFSTPHPYYILMPAKIEILWPDPYIVRFHDIVSPTEVETIKQKAINNNMHPGMVQGGKRKYAIISTIRVTKVVFLNETDHPIVPLLRKRVSRLTGLSTDYAERFHVANYGIGGHYSPHPDYYTVDSLPEEKKPKYGERVGTTLFYLSSPAVGGQTVFPSIALSVQPVERSAIFWRNIHLSNGKPDWRTIHASCPIMIGSKWISTIWITAMGQKLDCGLEDKIPF